MAPIKPKRFCRQPGCNALTHHTYCSRHTKQRSTWNHKRNRHERGYGTDWNKLRLQILSRDRYLCQKCLREGRRTKGNHVDHIIPKSQGGTDNPKNLQTLCVKCHNTKTGTMKKMWTREN